MPPVRLRPPCSGKQRDTESGLDFFGARFYFGDAGRWISADQPFADSHEKFPQTWNLYCYAANNPVRFFDPNGRGVLKGLGQGAWNFVKNTARGIVETVKNPTVIVTGTVKALETAGKAYFTEKGRRSMAATWNSLDTTQKTAVLTEATLQGVATALGAKASGLTGKLASKIEGALSKGSAAAAVTEPGPTTTLYHGGKLKSGEVQPGSFSTTTDPAHAAEYAAQKPGGQVYEFEVPKTKIVQWEKEGLAGTHTDTLSGTSSTATEVRIQGSASAELNNFRKK